MRTTDVSDSIEHLSSIAVLETMRGAETYDRFSLSRLLCVRKVHDTLVSMVKNGGLGWTKTKGYLVALGG